LSGEGKPDPIRVERLSADTAVSVDVEANEGLFTYRFSKRFRHDINQELATTITQYNPGNNTHYPCRLFSNARAAATLRTNWGVLQRRRRDHRKSRPVALIEVRPENLQAVNDWFKKLGFSHRSIKDIFGVKARYNSNRVFAPLERLRRPGITVKQSNRARRVGSCSTTPLYLRNLSK
jgi:hypothetical protein